MLNELPRREREIFEIICGAAELSAVEIRSRLGQPLSPSALRTLLIRLENRGLIACRSEGKTYFYRSVPQGEQVRASALKQMVDTLFNGSTLGAATALLGTSRTLREDELDALAALVEEARAKKGRP